MPIDKKQLKKLEKLAKIIDNPAESTWNELNNLDERVEKLEENITNEKVYVKGEKGEDGKDGIDGLNGIDGKNGLNGTNGKDGKDADPVRTAELASKMAQDALKYSIPTIPQIKAELSITGEKIRDNLEDLQGDERLDKKAIRGLEDLEKKINDNKNGGVRVIGGRAGFNLYVDGTKEGLIQTLNLIAGTGVTLTYSRNFGRNDITISNDSIAGTVLTATGTVNDTNKDFTFTSKPSIIVINGASYRETGGAITWTWATLTATLSSPVGVGGDIYGIR